MIDNSHKNLGNLRKFRNRELIKRMRSGEPLTSFDSRSSWFPPRPAIAKDPGALAQLYGAQVRPLNIEREESDNTATFFKAE